MEILITIKTHSTKLHCSFAKNWCNFFIGQIKGRLAKRQLKMSGIDPEKLYRTTLIQDQASMFRNVFCLYLTFYVFTFLKTK